MVRLMSRCSRPEKKPCAKSARRSPGKAIAVLAIIQGAAYIPAAAPTLIIFEYNI